jgi:hypothetical protein
MATPQSTIQELEHKAEQAAQSARELLDENVGKENVDAFIAILQPIGDFSIKALRTTVAYARKHPVRIGVTVLAIGVLSSLLAKSRSQRMLH